MQINSQQQKYMSFCAFEYIHVGSYICDFCHQILLMFSLLIMALFLSPDINDPFDVHYELLNVAHNWRGVGRAPEIAP